MRQQRRQIARRWRMSSRSKQNKIAFGWPMKLVLIQGCSVKCESNDSAIVRTFFHVLVWSISTMRQIIVIDQLKDLFKVRFPNGLTSAAIAPWFFLIKFFEFKALKYFKSSSLYPNTFEPLFASRNRGTRSSHAMTAQWSPIAARFSPRPWSPALFSVVYE